MSSNAPRYRVSTILLAAAAFAAGTSTALAAGAVTPSVSSDGAETAFTPDRVIERASDLVGRGQFVRARAMLSELSRGGLGLEMSDAQGMRVTELLGGCERRMRNARRAEVSLQKSELALSTNDLLGARRHAMGIEKMRDTNADEQARAATLLKLIDARRQTLEASAPALADAALKAMADGRHAEAKHAIGQLNRSGVALGHARQQKIDEARERLVDLEMVRGQAFVAPVSMALFGDPDESVTIEAQPVVEPLEDQAYQVEEQVKELVETTTDTTNYDPFDTTGFDPYQPVNKAEVIIHDAQQTVDTGIAQGSVSYGQPIIEPLDPITVEPQPGTVHVTVPAVTPPVVEDQMVPFTQPVFTPAASEPVYQSTPMGTDGSVDVIEAARKFEAMSLLGEARTAFDERRLNEALDKYNRVINEFGSYLTSGDLASAREQRAEVQVQLGTDGGPQGDTLDVAIADRELELQRVEATFRNLVSRAGEAMNTGDIRTARDLAAQARLQINRGRDVLSESDYEARIDEIENLIGRINIREEQLRISEAQDNEQRVRGETAAAEADRMAQRDQKISDALTRIRALQMELKYEEALQVVDQILFLDPINPAGLLLKDVIHDTIVFRRYEGYQVDKRRSYVEQFLNNEEAMIAPEEVFAYPTDWPAISMRRGQPMDFDDQPANRAVLATLGETSLPISFDENPLIDVIGFIQANTGLNIDVDWQSLEDIGIDQEAPVTLRLTDVSIQTVLDRVLGKVSDPDLPADWAVVDGILTIASGEVLRQNTVLEIYDIRDLLFVAPYYTDAPAISISQSSGGGGRGGGGGQSPFSGGGGGGGSQDRDNRDDRIQDIIDAIQNNVDPDGWIDLGGDTGAIQELDGNLIVTQTPKSHRQIVSMLNRLRETRAMQINVEARFLVVSEDFFEQIGFDLDVYLNGNNNSSKIYRGLDPSLLPSDMFDANGDLVTTITTNIQFDFDGDGTLDGPLTIPIFSPGAPPFGSGDEWSVIRGAQNSSGIVNLLGSAAGGFATDILSSNPALGITGRFLDDVQVDFMVEATQADRRSVTLTAPRLTFTNGQRAWVAVTTSSTYISDLTPVTGDSAIAFDPTISSVQEGVYLDIEGVVSADRRYITLTVETGISDVSFAAERLLSAAAGGSGGSTGGGIAESVLQFPITDSSQVKTTVTIPDQGTVMLGGQRLVTELEVESGVPVLNKIPILSRFFSNRMDVKEQKTLLILLKPTIIIQDEEEEMNFPGLSDQLGY